MIKKVRTDQLRVGVFIDDLNCSGKIKGRVFINKCVIQSELAIEIIRAWEIQEVFIDTEKGLDIQRGEGVIERRRKTDRILRQQAINSQPKPAEVPLWEEVDMARSIKNDAGKIINQAMSAVAENKAIAIDQTYGLIEKMERSVSRNRDALLLLVRIRKKDEYTLVHSISVGALVLAFCNYCGMPYETTINMAIGALLHDIGKTRVPIDILNKPGKLTPQELEIIRRHTEYSAEAMTATKDLPFEAFDIALHHHERNNGKGYPHQLKGEAINLAPKIASICDVYDALTSTRCYKPGMSQVAALRMLYESSSDDFDQKLVYKFINMIGVYPVGTCVRLSNDLLGMVVASTENNLQPLVRVFFDDRASKGVQIRDVDLAREGVEIASYEFMESWTAEKRDLYRIVKSQLNPLHQLKT
ncbi:MAG: HD-GYP domain-containing protein [Desulfopila sp.]